jgi:hypothetical protein
LHLIFKGVFTLIEYLNIDGERSFTTGFDISLNAMNVAFSEGSINIYDGSEKLYTTMEFPAFEFDCIADDTFEKIYIIYLIETQNKEKTVDVISAVLYEGNIPIYTNEDNSLIKTLAEIKIKANESDLNNSEILIYNIIGEDMTNI